MGPINGVQVVKLGIKKIITASRGGEIPPRTGLTLHGENENEVREI